MIRKSTLADVPAIRILLEQLGYLIQENSLKANMLTVLKHPDRESWVYVENHKIAAFISMHIISPIARENASAFITYLVVDQKFRNSGIGAKLETHCCDVAKRRGCGRIELHCQLRREEAHRFYENQGYEESRKYFTKYLKDEIDPR